MSSAEPLDNTPHPEFILVVASNMLSGFAVRLPVRGESCNAKSYYKGNMIALASQLNGHSISVQRDPAEEARTVLRFEDDFWGCEDAKDAHCFAISSEWWKSWTSYTGFHILDCKTTSVKVGFDFKGRHPWWLCRLLRASIMPCQRVGRLRWMLFLAAWRTNATNMNVGVWKGQEAGQATSCWQHETAENRDRLESQGG